MIKQFTQILQEINAGIFVEETSREYNKLIQAVRKTGKGGEITITLKVNPVTKGNGDIVVIKDDVKTKLPRFDRKSTMVYTTPEGNTTIRNPQQPELKGIDVASDNSDAIDVDGESKAIEVS